MQRISVVIPTFNRPHLLQRAIASVEQQDYMAPIEVVIVTTDTCPTGLRAIEEIVRTAKVTCKICVLNLDERAVASNPLLQSYAPAIIAHARNLGTAAAQGEFIAHLDEDNEYLPRHLSSLAEVLERSPDLPAAHSWRHLLWEDGLPFTDNLYPWMNQPTWMNQPPSAGARYVFEELVRFGVFQRDSCEVRDKYITPSGLQLLTVDSSEWLIRRTFHLRFPFRERLQFREVSHGLSDDYLFCQKLAEAEIKVGCTEKFTLNYYLRGLSSKWLNRTDSE